MSRIYTYNKLYNSNLTYLINFNFNTSKIISCTINDDNYPCNNYKLIRNYIYSLINNADIIILNRTLYITKATSGKHVITDLGIRVYSESNNRNIKEIINQVIKSNIKIKMEIRLVNGSIIILDY